MSIDEVHKIIDLLLVQEKTGKNTPEEKDRAIHLGQMDYFNSLRPQMGSQQAVGAQGTYINEALNPFRKVFPFNNGNTSGGRLQLTDSEHLMAILTQTSEGSTTIFSPIPLVNEDELANRLQSQIVMPTERNPIAHFITAKEVQFYPATPKAGKAFYLKTPEAPVWGYLETGRNLKYSEARSTDLEWTDAHIPQVIMRALQYLGVNLSADVVYQAAQQKQMETR
jgi:hypothetical protein